MNMSLPLLSLIIWLPMLGGFFLLVIKYLSKYKLDKYLKYLGLIICAISIGLCITLQQGFFADTWQMQWLENFEWLPALGIRYALGIDAISLLFVMLACLVSLLVIIYILGVDNLQNKHKKFTKNTAALAVEQIAAFLIMQGCMCGAFMALDAILFYMFFEVLLIQMFFVIGIFGTERRIYATLKFFLYTMLGSVLFLVSIIYLHYAALNFGIPLEDSFDISTLQALPLALNTQKLLFAALLLAFGIKLPMWPVHTWLPDAHTEAPTGGSVILAAIMLKIGAYAMLRFLLPILPDASRYFANLGIALSLIAIMYIALIAIVQQDMKRMIAYSSIAHMGMVTLGFFIAVASIANGESKNIANAVLAIKGSVFQMFSHGLIAAALFFSVGILYERRHTRLINDYSGVANIMPRYAVFFMLFALANIGLPGTSGFVGELLVILAAFKVKIWYSLIAASFLVFGAGYTLWLYKRVMFTEVLQDSVATLQDLTNYELVVVGCLVGAIIFFGVWPAGVIKILDAPVLHLVDQLAVSKI